MSDNGYSRLLIHPRHLLPEFPSVNAPKDALRRLLCGNPVNLPEFSSARMVKVFDGPNTLLAVAARIAGTLFQPRVVLLQTNYY